MFGKGGDGKKYNYCFLVSVTTHILNLFSLNINVHYISSNKNFAEFHPFSNENEGGGPRKTSRIIM